MFETLTLIAAWVGAGSGLLGTAIAIYVARQNATKVVVEVRDDDQGAACVHVVNAGKPTVRIEEVGYVMPQYCSEKRVLLKPERPSATRLEQGDCQDFIEHSSDVVGHVRALSKDTEPKVIDIERPVAYARTSVGKYFYSHGRFARWWRRRHKLG